MNKEKINEKIVASIVRIVTSVTILVLSYSLYISGPGLSFANGVQSGSYKSVNESVEESKPNVIDGVGVSFAFDGVNSNTIVLSGLDTLEGIEWRYSIDGGSTWNVGTSFSQKLLDVELNQLTDKNGISVKVVDTINGYERDFDIEIKSSKLPDNMYANDLENKVIGYDNTMEWRYANTLEWYQSTPLVNGNVSIDVRIKAHAQTLASEIKTFTFTEDRVDSKNKYVSIDKINLVKASSSLSDEFKGENVVDGNINTIWETTSSDLEKSIDLSLVNPIYLSSLEYVPSLVPMNGRVKSAEVYTSLDGNTWTLAGTGVNWADDSSVKKVTLQESVPTKYIRFVVKSSHGDGLSAHVAMLNVFEDNTKRVAPTAKVTYDKTTLTNGEVKATLEILSPDTEVVSEGGLTHTFPENGTFEFKYKNVLGLTGTTVAEVSWIDREFPIGTVKYSTTSLTSGPVVATLFANENIKILNNSGSNSYTFKSNGNFEFVYQDEAGNVSKTVASVSWIKKAYTVSTNKKPAAGSSSSSSSSNNNNSSDIEQPNSTETNNNTSTKKETDTFSVGNISIKFLDRPISTKYAFKKDEGKMNRSLKKKVGEDSSYFRLYFVDKDGKEVKFDQKMKITLKLDSSKDFKDLYKVTDKDKLEKLKYKKLSSNKIEVEVKDLGYYLIDYSNDDEEDSSFDFDYVIVGAIAMVLVVVAVMVYKKSRA